MIESSESLPAHLVKAKGECCVAKTTKEVVQYWPRKDLRHHVIIYDLKSFESHFEVTAIMLVYSCQMEKHFQA